MTIFKRDYVACGDILIFENDEGNHYCGLPTKHVNQYHKEDGVAADGRRYTLRWRDE